jgi:hypothetical protein
MANCRLPVEGAAQVRAAADAAAEAMASRFAGGRKAAHAAHANVNGRPVVPPETPSQSREPTPRDGDAAPQITVSEGVLGLASQWVI